MNRQEIKKRIWSDEIFSPADYVPNRLAAQHPQPSESLQPPQLLSPIPPTPSPPRRRRLPAPSSSDDGATAVPPKRRRIAHQSDARVAASRPAPYRPSASRPTASCPSRPVGAALSVATPPPVAVPPSAVAPVIAAPLSVSDVTPQWEVRSASREIKSISKIVTWNVNDIREHSKIQDDKFGRIRYTDIELWKNDQYKLVDDILRERLHNELKSKDVPEKFTIKSSERIRIRNSGELYIKCNCEYKITANSNGFWLRIGTIVVVTLSLRGQSEVKFLGYVTGTERNNELLKFEMIVASDYVDDLSRPSIVKIDASCNVQKLMKAYDAIHTAQKSNLLHGIINPKCFIPNGQRRGKWVKPENLYDGVLKARNTGNGFMTLVNGDRDIVEGHLFDVVKQVFRSNNEISILITGPAVHWIPLKLAEMGIFEFKNNSFIRFNENHAKEPHYENTINTTRIVLARVDELPKLNEYRQKFDAILINGASEITELDTLPALSFAPSSIILFGNENRRPGDRYRLFKNRDVNYNMKYDVYSTIFHRFLLSGRAPRFIKKSYRNNNNNNNNNSKHNNNNNNNNYTYI